MCSVAIMVFAVPKLHQDAFYSRTLILRSLYPYRFSVGRGGSVFLIASRFNHACKGRNNVDYSYDKAKKCMVLATKEKVTAGSELFIRYGSNPQHLFSTWGFRCSCGGCAGISEEECKAIETSSLGQGQDDSLVSSY
ncbi:hypothetical protein EV127DRAFT_429277 [Xylaria flabelliformis]|nr:hypothetical protein EV127DRAFT_429277 [Xylaria flabelliformis]